MKILFITHYSALYGANKSLLNLLDGIKNHGIQPFVVIPKNGEISKVLDEKKVPYIIQDFSWWCGYKPRLPRNPLKRLMVIIKHFKQNQVLVRNNLKNIQNLRIKLNNFKPDFIFSNSSVFNFGLIFSKVTKVPHIWMLRESQEHYNLSWFFRTKSVNRIFNSSDLIITVSFFLKNYYQKKNNIKNISILYNGVISNKNLSSLDLRRKKKEIRKNDFLVFGIVGLIHNMKGQAEAIRAFSLVVNKYPKTRLLIVGMGNPHSLKELAKNLNVLDKIEFWGHISDPFEAYLAMDVHLTCSRMEGLGRVTIEAMASNLPVIGYKEGGTIELIRENINGLFYESDYKELANKMFYMIENEDHRNEMGNKGREIVQNKFTTEVYAENFISYLEGYSKRL